MILLWLLGAASFIWCVVYFLRKYWWQIVSNLPSMSSPEAHAYFRKQEAEEIRWEKWRNGQ